MQSVKIEKVKVFGFEPALLGMRNALESWAKSDSRFGDYIDFFMATGRRLWDATYSVPEWPLIGPNDLALAKKLIRASASERKFLRQIWVWVDVTIPRNIWTEADTYKVATTRNSCSTMHKLGSRPLVEDDFADRDILPEVLEDLNGLGLRFREARGREKVGLLIKLKRHLPEGYLQKATYNFNYETALAIYRDRKNHRMPEWSDPEGLCQFIESLPYMKEFIQAAEAREKATRLEGVRMALAEIDRYFETADENFDRAGLQVAGDAIKALIEKMTKEIST